MVSHEIVTAHPIAVCVIVACATTLTLVLLYALLQRSPLWDVPNHRSSHTTPVLRGGGAALAVSMLLIGVVAAFALGSGSLLVLFGAITAGAGVGLTDDLRGLSVRARLFGQAACGVLLSTLALAHHQWLLAVCVVLGAVFVINATNFMDGVNAISSLHGLVVGGYFALIGARFADRSLTVSALIVGTAFLCFLPWNWPRARMFLGDVGSYALGVSTVALALLAVEAKAPVTVATAPLIVYGADVCVTLARRAFRGATLTDAHREHTYQRIQQLTGSHSAAAAICALATASCGAVALFFSTRPLSAWVLITGVLCVYLLMPKVLAHSSSTPTPSAVPVAEEKQ